MPLNLSDLCTFNSGVVFEKGSIFYILKSKFNTAAILTVLIILLLMILCPFKKNTKSILFIKLGLYIFLMTCGLLIVHDGILINENKTGIIDISDDNTGYGSDVVTPTIKPTNGGKSGGNQPTVIGGDTESFLEAFGV
jgi:hypothetical protein